MSPSKNCFKIHLVVNLFFSRNFIAKCYHLKRNVHIHSNFLSFPFLSIRVPLPGKGAEEGKMSLVQPAVSFRAFFLCLSVADQSEALKLMTLIEGKNYSVRRNFFSLLFLSRVLKTWRVTFGYLGYLVFKQSLRLKRGKLILFVT